MTCCSSRPPQSPRSPQSPQSPQSPAALLLPPAGRWLTGSHSLASSGRCCMKVLGFRLWVPVTPTSTRTQNPDKPGRHVTAWAEDAASRVSRGWGSRARAALVLDPGLQTGERVCVALTPAMTAVGSAAASLFNCVALLLLSLCVLRCPNEFTGDRCQNYVMASFYSTSLSSSSSSNSAASC